MLVPSGSSVTFFMTFPKSGLLRWVCLASCCTGVGSSQSSSSTAWMISGQIPNSSKALIVTEKTCDRPPWGGDSEETGIHHEATVMGIKWV